MKYTKKPVVIEAVAWNGKYTDPSEWPDWFNDAIKAGVVKTGFGKDLLIVTLEGNHWAGIGDMIIRGVKGELYPCKPDIFELTYEMEAPVTTMATGTLLPAGDAQNDGKTQGKTDHRRSVEK